MVFVGYIAINEIAQSQTYAPTSLVAQWLRIRLPVQGTWV